MCSLRKKRVCSLLCGDFNARTNDVNDFIENNKLDYYLPIDDNYLPDQHLDKRLNKDTYPINASGTAFYGILYGLWLSSYEQARRHWGGRGAMPPPIICQTCFWRC